MITVIKLLPGKLKIKSLALIAMAIASAYIASLLPGQLGAILDSFVSDPSSVKALIIPFGVLFLLVELVAIVRRVLSDRLAAQYGEVLTNLSLKILLWLPKQTLEGGGTSGDITKKTNDAVEGATQLLKLATNDIVPTVFLGGFTIYQCFIQSTSVFGYLMLGYIICSIVASTFQILSQKGIRVEIFNSRGHLHGEIVQSVNGIEQIRALGAETAECERLAPQINRIRTQGSKHHTYMGMFDTLKQTLKAGFIAVIFFVGVSNVVSEVLTGGAVIAVYMLFQQLLKPVDEIYRFLDDISASSVKVGELKKKMALPIDEVFTTADDGADFTEDSINIESYQMLSTHGDSRVISKGENIILKQGKSTAIIAKTGGGKSSLLRGLMRIYPIEGTIRLFGKNNKKVSHRQLVESIHYVPQNPFFFAGTLRDNLSYGLPGLTDDDMNNALKKATLYDELAVDGNPLDKLLQEGGKPLSGGQIKRLAIARAFLRKPRIYLFDEAFTGIDVNTLSNIFNNLDVYAKEINAGIVHISHEKAVKDRCSEQFNLDV